MTGYAVAAPEYRAAGWHGVLPIAHATKGPPPAGWTGAEGRWPDDDQVAGWSRSEPDANVALRPPVDVIALDLDIHKVPGARAALEAWLGCALPPTWVSTARADGSGHYWYRVDPPGGGARWAGAPVPGCEVIQTAHRYAVVSPSAHPGGARYRWIDPTGEVADRAPSPPDLPPLPQAAQRALLREPAPAVEREPRDFDLPSGEPSPRVRARLDRALLDLTAGSRHDSTRDHVMALVRLGEQGEAGVAAALDELRAAFVGAVGQDRPDAGREFDRMASGAVGKVARTGLEPRRVTPYADIANADRLAALHGDRMRWVQQWGSWVTYRAGAWHLDPTGAAVIEWAKDVPAQVAREAASTDPASDEYDRAAKWAKASSSAARLRAAAELARGAEGVMLHDHETFDADPEALNCRNGTLDLATGRLRPHSPADLQMKQAAVDFDPGAEAPLWDECLRTWQPDPEMRRFLQLVMGASATGYPTEALYVHLGGGANGKSRFVTAISDVLGPYAVQPDKSLLVQTRHEQHPTVLASLFRARLAVASETEAGARLSEASVKNLTGGDTIRARRMREDEWSFRPSHTLHMFSNHRPHIRGGDEGIWRRVRLVPWDVTIPRADRRADLGQVLAQEAPGILRWLAEGARDWLAAGRRVDEPDAVREATDGYRLDEDTVARFLREEGVCVVPGARTSSAELSAAHEEWCEANGLHAPRHFQQVSERLKAAGAEARRTAQGRAWGGVRIDGAGHDS